MKHFSNLAPAKEPGTMLRIAGFGGAIIVGALMWLVILSVVTFAVNAVAGLFQ